MVNKELFAIYINRKFREYYTVFYKFLYAEILATIQRVHLLKTDFKVGTKFCKVSSVKHDQKGELFLREFFKNTNQL